MSLNYEELDFRKTPLGDLMLRRRRMFQFAELDIYEVKLGEDFLMSSLFHEAESKLSKFGLGLLDGEALDVVVGGLGLGYTAAAALDDQRVTSLIVVEFMAGVIEWHQNGLVPLGKRLTSDSRCTLVHDDFFALSRDVRKGFDPKHPERKHNAILLDIDHTPTNVLHQTNRRFYSEVGLVELAQHLQPGGVFGLWADGLPDGVFSDLLAKVFATVQANTIEFDNPLTGRQSAGTVYLARNAINEMPA